MAAHLLCQHLGMKMGSQGKAGWRVWPNQGRWETTENGEGKQPMLSLASINYTRIRGLLYSHISLQADGYLKSLVKNECAISDLGAWDIPELQVQRFKGSLSTWWDPTSKVSSKKEGKKSFTLTYVRLYRLLALMLGHQGLSRLSLLCPTSVSQRC